MSWHNIKKEKKLSIVFVQIWEQKYFEKNFDEGHEEFGGDCFSAWHLMRLPFMRDLNTESLFTDVYHKTQIAKSSLEQIMTRTKNITRFLPFK